MKLFKKMQTIKILDKETVNKIAAGEVIERPYSVVKELVENSIDAGAKNIIVEVKNGGKDKIIVSDDGKGMNVIDAKLCFVRHATSKLKDLFSISTLGFRGEALSSISAVSNLKLSTNDGNCGINLEISEGKLLNKKEIGMNKGTKIEVSDLFFNTPVRKNYLKSREVELSHIINIITKYSLSNIDISFKLISDSKDILVSPKTKDLLNKIVAIYGKELAKNMVAIKYKDDFIGLNGYVGKPYLTKLDKSMQTLFINNRYVKSDIVSKAIYDAYHTLLFLNRHPVVMLNIEIDFSETDVNVHPTKNVIRIEKEKELYDSVFSALRECFVNNNMIPDVSLDKETKIQVKQNYKMEKGEQTLLMAKQASSNLKDYATYKKTENVVSVQNKIGPIKVLGQLNRMYVLAENSKGLLIIDQHAIQERVYFERFWKEFKAKKIIQQKLLKPIIIDLSVNETHILNSNIKIIQNLGFDIDSYGRLSFIVRQVPKIFGEFTKDTILDLVSSLKDVDKLIDEKKEEKLAKKACRKSIKAGEVLTLVQMQKLVSDLDDCTNPFSCPHGRPTMINITLGDLEKKFKRVA
jgi:DNA mismatch repair protein MutL